MNKNIKQLMQVLKHIRITTQEKDHIRGRILEFMEANPISDEKLSFQWWEQKQS